MDPQLTMVRPTTGTFGHGAMPVTLVNVPKMATATQTVLPPLRIDAKAVLGKTIAGGVEGEKLYPLIKNALQKGRKVALSVKGLDLSGWFFDDAICRLYGDFDADTVDNNVEVVDIRKVDTYSLNDMKEVRKLYYYNRPAFDELMSAGDPDLDCSKDFSDDFIVGDDIYAPGRGRWADEDEDDEDFSDDEDDDFNDEDE
jgi:hypothetical protein